MAKIVRTDFAIEDSNAIGESLVEFTAAKTKEEREIVDRFSVHLISEYQLMKRMNSKPTGEESDPRVPTDLRKALAATSKAKAQWSDLTPIARRDFIRWIDSDKQPERHRRRIEKACAMLPAGKRRP